MIKAIIFDMDGTVIDSTMSDFQSMQKAFFDFQVDFTYDDYIQQVGSKGEEIVASKANFSDNEIHQILNRKDENFKDIVRKNGIKAVDNIEHLLLKIKEIPLWTALATGSNKEKVDFIMDRVKVEQYFDIVLTAEDVNEGKPDPALFLKAAKNLNVLPEECLVFEDAIMGIRAAKLAGMKCVALKGSSPEALLQESDLIIDSYLDPLLMEFIEQLSSEKV